MGHDRADAELEHLRWHWGEAYIICHPEPNRWIAERRDTHETITDETSVDLRDRLVADYFTRPVSRDIPPPEE